MTGQHISAIQRSSPFGDLRFEECRAELGRRVGHHVGRQAGVQVERIRRRACVVVVQADVVGNCVVRRRLPHVAQSHRAEAALKEDVALPCPECGLRLRARVDVEAMLDEEAGLHAAAQFLHALKADP